MKKKRKPKKKSELEKIIPPFTPIKIKFGIRDFLQILIGASVLAVPVGFTEETWKLGETLPLTNILFLMLLTIFFISIFTYSHYHRKYIHTNTKHHVIEMTKRVLVTYIFSFIAVSILLGIIQVTPWQTNTMLAFKRVVIVTFPSALAATISDTIK